MVRTLAALVLAGCATAPAPRFDLVCESSRSGSDAELHCLRLDLADGDVRRVALSSIPVSQGPTSGARKGPGAYKLVCGATSSADKSSIYCVRLDTGTGELMLVNLPKTPVFPEGTPTPRR